jgi:hypothetical protein
MRLFVIVCLCTCCTLLMDRARGADTASPREIRIGGPSQPTRVPAPLRRGTFLAPQTISAIDISDDARSVAVGTMAFRHDQNFFLLSADNGKLLWTRYVEPWAPSQVAALTGRDGGPAAFASAMVFSRQTEPFPVISLFRGAQDKELAAIDDVGWDRGLLRYGAGDDWRTGWTASVLGDAFARAPGALLTVPSHDNNAWRWDAAAPAAGGPQRFALPSPRPFRMAASGDGRVLALGYMVPDVSNLDEQTRQRLQPNPPASSPPSTPPPPPNSGPPPPWPTPRLRPNPPSPPTTSPTSPTPST